MDDDPFGEFMNRIHGFLRRVVVLVPWVLGAYVALMFAATHTPVSNIPSTLPGTDKHWHFLGYFGLGLLLSLWGQVRFANWPVVTLVTIALYGAADELLQIPVGRQAEFLDWAADMAGAATGIAATVLLTAPRWMASFARSRAG